MANPKPTILDQKQEDLIVKHRYLTSSSVGRGQPPFKSLAKRFVQLTEQAGKASAPEDVDKSHKDFLRELGVIEHQAKRLRAVQAASLCEQQNYQQRQNHLELQIQQAKQDIEDKKLELQLAKVERQHNEEYEALRRLVMEHPSRANTQEQIERLEAEIVKVEQDEQRVVLLMEKRRKQFALLLHVIEDLQRTEDDGEEEADADQMEMDA